MMVDFRWTETLIRPDVAQGASSLQVMNVAPIVADVSQDPTPGLEGSPVELFANFEDPGLDDTWEYRWRFDNGEVSNWRSVDKMSGVARVLFLDTYGPQGPGLSDAVRDLCGTFCVKWDRMDWGPTGQNRVPSLDELTPYDVLVLGVNYFHYNGGPMGDVLADYMDAADSTGGGVILAQGAMDSAFGCNAGICGRFDDEGYSPVPREYIYGPSGSLGAIFEPLHTLLDGVASTTTTPIVENGARSVALNFFPVAGYTGGDFRQMMANAVRWASRQVEPVLLTMPITLTGYPKIFVDDNPTTTPEDTYPVWVDVRDDDHDKIQVTSTSAKPFNDFQVTAQCTPGAYYLRQTFPPGWSSSPNPYGWAR